MRQTIKFLGVALILIGTAALLAPTLGMSTIATDRTTSIDATDQQDALVGLEPLDEEVIRGKPADVVKIHNNFESTIILETTVQTEDRLAVADDADGDEIEPGEETVVAVECGNSEGSETVEVTVNEAVTDDNTASVAGASISNTVNYDCRGNAGTGEVNFGASNVEEANPEQRFTFNLDGLDNIDDATIDLTEPQENGDVDYTGLSDDDIEVTEGSVSDIAYEAADNEIVLSPQGASQDEMEVEISGFDVTGDTGGFVEYTDSEDRFDGDSFDVFGKVVESDDSPGEIDDVDGDVIVENEGRTDDEVDIDGDIIYQDDTTAEDEVDAGNVIFGDNPDIQDEVTSDGEVTIGDDADIGDELNSGGNVTIGDDADIGDELNSNGDLTIGDGSVASDEIQVSDGGDLEITGDVTFEDEVTVDDGDLIISETATVTFQNELDVGGNVEIDDQATVTAGDEADVGDDMFIDERVSMTFDDDISVGGTAFLGCDSTFEENEPSDIEETCE